jgi:hypothetical protein
VHLIPRWGTRAGKIKASCTILFDGGGFRQKSVKFSIMAENYPAFCRYFADPFIIGCLFIEAKLVLRIVVIFN